MKLTHVSDSGKAAMVDVGNKQSTKRIARASAIVHMNEAAYNAIRKNEVSKGDVLAVARIAGIQAAKKTAELIPLCHQLLLHSVDVHIDLDANACLARITGEVKTTGTTGVEMEALTATSVAALTIYDMCKALDRGITIAHLSLEYKSGGKSGDWSPNA